MLPFLTLDLVLAESFFGAISLIRSALSSSSFNLSLLTSCCAGNLLVTDVTERYDVTLRYDLFIKGLCYFD